MVRPTRIKYFDVEFHKGVLTTSEAEALTGESSEGDMLYDSNAQELQTFDYSSKKWKNVSGYFVHSQITPSNSWIINHDLGKFPNIQIFDSANTLIMPDDIVHDSPDSTTITLNYAMGGFAYCS